MYRSGQTNLHANAIMVLVGLICALCNTLPLAALIYNSELEQLPNVGWVYGLVAATAFLTFTQFQQIISARNTWWILRGAISRWARVLLILVLSLFFILSQGIDVELLQQLIIEWAAITFPLLMIGLALTRNFIHRFNNLPSNRRKVVFFGLGPLASQLSVRLQRSPVLGIEVVGYFSAEPVPADAMLENTPPYLGTHEDAWPRIRASEFDMVVIQPDDYYDGPLSTRLFEALHDSTAAIYIAPETRWSTDVIQSGAEIAGVPLLAIHDTPIIGAARLLKRVLDITAGGIAVLLLSPVMIGAAIAVRISSPGPILFKQARYGERGQQISVYKFRSMYINNQKGTAVQQASQHDPRITRVGRFLRRTSLDELPQLFNVLGGSMSLVGPRPHAVVHNEEYRQQISGYMLRHSIKPGITGWAQIHGLRGETDTLDKMRRRIEYDRYYIKHWSLRLDIHILFRTVWTVLRGDNAY